MEVDLDLALRIAEVARDRAASHGALVSVAVVDAGGHRVAFTRMDGAEIAGPVLARDKAYTAVAHRCGTDELTELVSPGAALAGMSSADGAGARNASSMVGRKWRMTSSSSALGYAKVTSVWP